VDGIILALLETHITRELASSEYAFAAQLLASHLVERVRTMWTDQDVEMAGLLQEFEMWSMDDIEWSSVLCAFDKNTRAGIESWLREWHARTQRIAFSSAKIPQRQVRLFVDMPQRPLLVTAFLDVYLTKSETLTAAIGQPILADLVVGLYDENESGIEGSFELAPSSESWLIGGRRKGNMSLTAEPARIRVVLFPQHLGHLLLPTISVRCRRHVEGGDKNEWTDVMNDVQNPNHGRSILITQDMRSTTVEVFGAIPDEGMGRLLASQSRESNR